MIKGRVIGDKAVIRELDAKPGNINASVKKSIMRFAIGLQRLVVESKLSGTLLHRRTGTLSRSFARIGERDLPSGFIAVVGSRVNDANKLRYAEPLEYGFNGSVTVKEHLRTIKAAFGRTLKEPVTFSVRSHSMQMNIKEYAYLRSSFNEMKPAIIKGIGDAVTEGLKK